MKYRHKNYLFSTFTDTRTGAYTLQSVHKWRRPIFLLCRLPHNSGRHLWTASDRYSLLIILPSENCTSTTPSCSCIIFTRIRIVRLRWCTQWYVCKIEKKKKMYSNENWKWDTSKKKIIFFTHFKHHDDRSSFMMKSNWLLSGIILSHWLRRGGKL